MEEKSTLNITDPFGFATSHRGACITCFLFWDAPGLPGSVGAGASFRCPGGGGGGKEASHSFSCFLKKWMSISVHSYFSVAAR